MSGADISQFGAERTDALAQERYGQLINAAYLALAAGCDIRICADDARFRMPAGRLGLGYEQAGVRRFVSLIGVQNTYDIFFRRASLMRRKPCAWGSSAAWCRPHSWTARCAK